MEIKNIKIISIDDDSIDVILFADNCIPDMPDSLPVFSKNIVDLDFNPDDEYLSKITIGEAVNFQIEKDYLTCDILLNEKEVIDVNKMKINTILKANTNNKGYTVGIIFAGLSLT